MLYLSMIVLIPLAAVFWHAAAAGSGGVLGGRDHVATRVAALKLTLGGSLIVVVVNAVDRHGDRLGARARRLPRQDASSTR